MSRPFLSLSSATLNCDKHISICLLAARTTIHSLHSAFTHRHYIRSWWYNETHILYTSTILLHVLLLDKPDILSAAACDKASLIEDVHKSPEILRAMDQMLVAVRYADLLGDILEVVGQSSSKHQSSHEAGIQTQDLSSNASNGNSIEYQGADRTEFGENASQSQQETSAAPAAKNSVLSRNDVLASLMDPNSIINFDTGSDDLMFGAVDGWNVAGNVFSDFTFTGDTSTLRCGTGNIIRDLCRLCMLSRHRDYPSRENTVSLCPV